MLPRAFSSPDRATRIGVIALTIAVFGAVVGFVTWQLRIGLREQVLQNEAAVLTEVASMELAHEAVATGGMELPGTVFAAALRASKIRGVFAVRAFDAQGLILNGEPSVWSEDPPAEADTRRLARNEPIARLHVRTPNDLLAVLQPTRRVSHQEDPPLVEIWVGMRQDPQHAISGVAQFWSDGALVEGVFDKIDRRLFWQAILAWGAGSLVITAALAWAFSRLAAANRELFTRSENLRRANRELVLSAKTSALGSVTAHLIHALKNPIAGLEVFVASKASPSGLDDGAEELAAATELTRRLRTMVNDVVAVMRDEETGAQFELSCEDMVAIAIAKARPLAAVRRVQLSTQLMPPTIFSARRANLAALALYNLLQNAIEATPEGGTVQVGGSEIEDGAVELTITDTGNGLPSQVRARLFEPCTSSKVGGSGLGLSLSQQLARHAGGRIELVRSDRHGTSFRLVLDFET